MLRRKFRYILLFQYQLKKKLLLTCLKFFLETYFFIKKVCKAYMDKKIKSEWDFIGFKNNKLDYKYK